MQQNANVQCWADCWDAVSRQDSAVSDTWLASFWSKRSAMYSQNMSRDNGEKRVADALALLNDAGFSPAGAHVLDIGCGPGTLSLPLARAGANVTALDIAPGMLDQLRGAARNEELVLTPVECSWWTADIDQMDFRDQFDLVIASMTPGIRDRECFDRMTACSKKFCYYSGFVRREWDKAYTDISRYVLHEDFNNRVTSMLYPFMYLYSQGHTPLTRFSQTVWKEDEPWEAAAERAIDFMARGREFDNPVKEWIREYYRAASHDGIYPSVTNGHIGMMVWTVNRR